jgi:hypothetical protein
MRQVWVPTIDASNRLQFHEIKLNGTAEIQDRRCFVNPSMPDIDVSHWTTVQTATTHVR